MLRHAGSHRRDVMGYGNLLMYTDKGRQKTPIYPPQWLNVVNSNHFVSNLLEFGVFRASFCEVHVVGVCIRGRAICGSIS